MILLQVVWKATTSIGCGIATDCNTYFDNTFTLGNILVCDYYPAGNGDYSLYSQNVLPAGTPAPLNMTAP
jgi:Cysteine-rich secretory protein family